jgi:Ca-activated chloride channel homolog
MTFGSPLLLVTLLAVPTLGIFACRVERRPSRYAVAFTNLEVLASVASTPHRRRRWIPLALLLAALAAAATALARPRITTTARDRQGTVVLLVDVSGSMASTDVAPTRLAAAQSAMTAFLNVLPRRYHVGLIAFSNSADILSPPTTDRDELRVDITSLTPEAGTAIGDALASAATMFEPAAGREEGRPRGAIVLVSDGTQTSGRQTPLAGAALARRAGIRLDTIALGTTHGVPNMSGVGGSGPFAGTIGFGGHTRPAPPDVDLLARIAKATGGRSYVARSARHLVPVYTHLARELLTHRHHREISAWFAGAAAALLLASVTASGLLGPRLP